MLALLCIQRFVYNNKFLDQVNQINELGKIENLELMVVLEVVVPMKKYLIYISHLVFGEIVIMHL